MSNASEFAAVREADLGYIESHFSNNTFSHTSSGASGVCSPSSLNAGMELEIGGKTITVKRTLIIRVSLFPAVPVARTPITFADVEYRIAQVKTSGDGVHYEIDIYDLSQK